MRNERGAGRKPQVTSEQLDSIRVRYQAGESLNSLAKAYGVSRQALYARLKVASGVNTVQISYMIDGNITTNIMIDWKRRDLQVENLSGRISTYAFGICSSPSWEELSVFLEKLYFRGLGIGSEQEHEVAHTPLWICEQGERYSVRDVAKLNPDRLQISGEDTALDEKIFSVGRKDLIYARTDTDGFQCKALSKDRKWFLKAQAVISGVVMDDWRVEIIASDLCRQLGIPCVNQWPCKVIYGNQKYNAVYSRNFELDGYEFVSFERLISQLGLSTYDKEFVQLDAIGKLEWCADKLADIGNLSYQDTLKYMIDLALIDCLVGNVDRHTRNFGLFYDSLTEKYSISLIFDNGMGLFEHDSYRDTYDSFEEAMRTVYVSPYGEDPFDMLELLNAKYNLNTIYSGLKTLQYPSSNLKPFAAEYVKRVRERLAIYG